MDDIDKTLEKVVDLRGRVVIARSKIDGSAMATFADPDGKLFGLYEYAKK